MPNNPRISLTDPPLVKILSLNVKGAKARRKVADILAYTKDRSADIAFIIESHITNDRCETLQTLYSRHRWITNSPTSNARGITAIVLNEELGRPKTLYTDNDGRVLVLQLACEGTNLNIMAIYAPNTEEANVQFLQSLQTLAKLHKVHIIVGDFNRVLESNDRNPPRQESPRIRQAFQLLLEDGYVDGWREANHPKRQFTYWQDNEYNSSSRIDRIYVKANLFHLTAFWEITDKPPFTDHAGVTVTIHPGGAIEKGPGLWKFPPDLLADKAISLEISLWLAQTFTPILSKSQTGTETDLAMEHRDTQLTRDLHQAWIDLREFLEQLTLRTKRRKSAKSKRINKALTYWDSKKRSPKAAKRIRQILIRKTAWDEAVRDRAIIAQQQRWISIGHATSKEFWDLPKQKTKNMIPRLQDHKNKICSMKEALLNIAAKFYEQLYSKRDTDKQLTSKLLSVIDAPPVPIPDGKIMPDEVTKAISKLDIGRAPGPDGIPHEFFIWMCSPEREGGLSGIEATQTLCLWANLSLFSEITIPPSIKESTISIMYKKGDPSDIKNYRPLSLLNTLYKMFTIIINNRIKEAAHEQIHPDQTGFVADRKIHDAIKRTQAIIDIACIRKTPLHILFVDQEKAYDRVDHEYLLAVLQAFKFPTAIIRAIQKIYSEANSRIMINGFLTRPVPILAGVRQGDPLSCLLFNYAIEPLAIWTRRCLDIPGIIDQRHNRHKISLYADDVAIFLTDKTQLAKWMKIYRLYSRASGGAMNVDKTKLLCINSPPKEEVAIQEITREFTYLGIPVGDNVHVDQYWEQRTLRLQQTIAKWEKIHISRFARARVINTAMESQLWYGLQSLPITLKRCDELQLLCQRYLWKIPEGSKCRSKIPLHHTYKPRADGGLHILHIKTMKDALQLRWIQAMDNAYLDGASYPSWYWLVFEMFLATASPSAAPMIQRPWTQKWMRTEPRFPPSIQSFWDTWTKYRDAALTPTTAREVHQTVFWYHPQINQERGGIRWLAPIWKEIWNGNSTCRNETIAHLLLIRETDSRTDWRGAAVRIMRKIPESWFELAGSETLNLDTRPLPIHIYTAKNNRIKLATSDNHQRYKILLKDMPPKKKVTLVGTYVTQLLATENLSLPSDFWLKAQNGRVDYPLLSDLLWLILHGKVSTGEAWMRNSGNCPVCACTQTTSHLFWDCPLAQSVWREVRRVCALPGIHLQTPPTWARLVYSICNPRECYRDPGETPRTDLAIQWRIISSTAIWALWRTRCEWSFDELERLTKQAAVNEFMSILSQRLLGDRYNATFSVDNPMNTVYLSQSRETILSQYCQRQ